MKNSVSKIALVTLLFSVSACSQSEFAVDRGAPEHLIDTSSEEVSFALNSKNSLSKISSAIAKDAPARAELKCFLSNSKCAQAKKILERRSIPVHTASAKSDSVTLVYERVVARDCNPRFADNTHDSSRVNHPAFGCSVSGNMVQMIGNKRQLTNPVLLDLPDAEKGVKSYQNYLKSSPASGKSSAQAGDTGIVSSK